MKYIYGPATVDASRDGVIGSSIAGRIETAIGIDRLRTIAMLMKGSCSPILSYIPCYFQTPILSYIPCYFQTPTTA